MIQLSSSLAESGHWMYSGNVNAIPEEPRVFTRTEKNQALTHLEMDFNLASLHHKLETSSKGPVTIDPPTTKPTREEEMKGMFVTFSYAPIKGPDGTILVQNDPQIVKVQHTTDEILQKISGEEVPGDFSVSGSFFVKQGIEAESIKAKQTAELEDLRVNRSASVSGDLYVEGNLYIHGVMYGNLSSSAYNTPDYATQSDIRLKNNLQPISSPLEKVKSIQGYEFDWKEEAEKSGHDVGLVAQELQKIVPEAVTEGADGYLRVDYEKVIPLLVSAINELTWQVRELQNSR